MGFHKTWSSNSVLGFNALWLWDSCRSIKNFDEGISGLNMYKLIEISMDEPSVNWKFMKAVVANREEAELTQLIDAGTHFVFSFRFSNSFTHILYSNKGFFKFKVELYYTIYWTKLNIEHYRSL